MTPEEMKGRTKTFALRVIKLADALPDTGVARVIKNQFIHSGTSVGANYRAACRAKSPADFINKMGTVEEETDEAMYWMEIIVEARLMADNLVSPLCKEADEILSIVVASIKTSKKRK